MGTLHDFNQLSIPIPSFTYICPTVTGKGIFVATFVECVVQPNDFLMNISLIIMYTGCGSVLDARKVYDKLLRKSGVSWNFYDQSLCPAWP